MSASVNHDLNGMCNGFQMGFIELIKGTFSWTGVSDVSWILMGCFNGFNEVKYYHFVGFLDVTHTNNKDLTMN